MKILITGGAGFIGLHLAKFLAKNQHQLVLVDNFSRGVEDKELKNFLDNKKVQLFSGNLLQQDFVDTLPLDCDVIVHLAAIIGVANVNQYPYRVLTENVALLEKIIQLGKKQKSFKKLLFASTSEVAAGALKNFTLPVPTNEEYPLALTNLSESRTSYMLSKIYGEAMCIHSGLPYVVFRPHNVFGPRMGMNHVVPELFKKALALDDRQALEVFSADHKRAFCYIDDAVEQIAAMISIPECLNVVLNLGNQSEEVPMRLVAQNVLKILQKNNPLKELPPTPGSPERRAPDMSKSEKLLRIKAKVGLEEGMRQTFAWYRDFYFKEQR